MPKSAVAGIVSSDGGLRFVVTQRWRMRQHVRKGERLFVVPDYWVDEPVPWEEIPGLVHRVTGHVYSILVPDSPCGECRACCVTLYIDGPGFETPKPSHTPCSSCDAELGCMKYLNRPRVCRTFECMWLKSKKTNRIWPDDMRPDRCGVIFTDREPGYSPETVMAHSSIASAMSGFRVGEFIAELEDDGAVVIHVTHYTRERQSA